MRQDYAQLGAQGMASLLGYVSMQSEVSTGALSNIRDTLQGWEPHYMCLQNGAQMFNAAYLHYKFDQNAWGEVAAAAWTLAKMFQGLGNMESPLCQERAADGRVCGRTASASRQCIDPSNHAQA